jgi:ABC-type phosphate transport system substrate-binding protein
MRFSHSFKVLFSRSPIFLLLILSACCPTNSSSGAGGEAGAVIENKGSDTIVNLALAWAESYQKVNPNIRPSELEHLRELQLQGEQFLSTSQLRLDAVRVAIAT